MVKSKKLFTIINFVEELKKFNINCSGKSFTYKIFILKIFELLLKS